MGGNFLDPSSWVDVINAQNKALAGDAAPQLGQDAKADFGPLGKFALNPEAAAAADLAGSGFQNTSLDSGFWNDLLKKRSTESAINPYADGRLTADATRARPGQMDAIAQLLALSKSPNNVVDQQSRIAGAANTRALGAAALAGGGQPALAQGVDMGTGLAGQTGQARLQNYLALQNGAGFGAGDVRGQDQGLMQNQMNSALGAKQLTNQGQEAAAGQANDLVETNAKAALDRYRLMKALQLQYMQGNMNVGRNLMGAVGTGLSTAAGAA